MGPEIWVICGTAATIGFLHTVFGPDHYLPFVMIGRARNWSHLRLAVITVLCGVGHVGSSILLGFLGIAAGMALARLEIIEGFRGELASYLLMAFGIIYGLWGLRQGILNKPHRHVHVHADGDEHEHEHLHDHLESGHRHFHEDKEAVKSVTIWTLFIIFVLGPCEPLIPLIMFPASMHSIWGVVLVSAIFGVVTITTMTAIALGLYSGMRFISTKWLERYIHAIAGFVIAASGGAIVFLGL